MIIVYGLSVFVVIGGGYFVMGFIVAFVILAFEKIDKERLYDDSLGFAIIHGFLLWPFTILCAIISGPAWVLQKIFKIDGGDKKD